MTCEIFKWLSKKCIFVSVRPTAIDEQWGKIPTELRAQMVTCRQPEDWELLVATPDTVPTPGRKTVFWSMFESSEMPPEYVALLNRAELVIVPCRWNAECFAADGVKVPIAVVPLGFDPDVFRPSKADPYGPCIFGVAGRTKHCAKRKSVQPAIDLFLKTFPSDEGVRLHVKVHPDDHAESRDPRVKITKAHFESYELAQWLSNLTAFMTLSRGEGFSLWPMQAMACGRAVIGMSYSGQADFMDSTNSFIIPHRVIDAVSGESNVEYLGQWADPNLKEAANHMMYVRKFRGEAIVRGQVAAATVADFTWENAADKLIVELEKVGAL